MRSSSNSSKFEDDEFTGFAENNTKIPNAKEERAVFPNGMEKYNWYWAARQMPKTLFTREEIQEFRRWIKLKKHYQGKERKQTVECWLMGRFVLIFRIFFWCVNKFARVSNTESAHSDANEFVPNNKGSSTIAHLCILDVISQLCWRLKCTWQKSFEPQSQCKWISFWQDNCNYHIHRLLINQKCYLNESVAHWYALRKHLTLQSTIHCKLSLVKCYWSHRLS